MTLRLTLILMALATSSCRADGLHLAEAFATKSSLELSQFLKDYSRSEISRYRYGNNQNVVHAATVNRENTDAVKQAVLYGADVNHQDEEGRTPLHYAIDLDDLAKAKSLMELGAATTIENASGFSAISFCAVVLRDQPRHKTCSFVVVN
ncbi:ankyrin repeat domain-containing protein [uncultured Roseobacter sp.]|uniref:ankyrin repeat domain-containing protein n=1 Tax=uncultured Roseobacter sp. TaxID=114847 RepID=UPI00260D5677|nr:ankyrin repeat domain-containing protein [uncultured Roseobacter sp.]